jgi:hypothetical protein
VNLKVIAFRAKDNPILCEEYAKGHRELLQEYGVTSITSNNRTWDQHAGTYLVLARDMDSNELIGGIRIQRFSAQYELPVQSAIGHIVPEINERIISDHNEYGSGEMCGLWNSRKVAKMRVSWLLTRASVVICSQIGVKSLWGICADYTLPMFENVGYRIIEDIGEKGCFAYPTPEYISHPVRMNAISLETTAKVSAREISDLRETLVQKKKFKGEGYKLNIEYNLDLKGR